MKRWRHKFSESGRLDALESVHFTRLSATNVFLEWNLPLVYPDHYEIQWVLATDTNWATTGNFTAAGNAADKTFAVPEIVGPVRARVRAISGDLSSCWAYAPETV